MPFNILWIFASGSFRRRWTLFSREEFAEHRYRRLVTDAELLHLLETLQGPVLGLKELCGSRPPTVTAA